MSSHPDLDCATCETQECRDGVDCHGVAEASLADLRKPEVARIHRAAGAIEARHYGRETRLGETVLFAREMGFRRLGLAFCVGLAEEARVVAEILGREFEVASVCCKAGGVDKADLGLEQIRPDAELEVSCNPVAQARLLNEAGTDLNVVCGLCVGHDALFAMHSEAPVTTLVAKDRVLAHNPLGAVYCPYVRRRLERPGEG
jgi:uncharacterized metal-binding protein